MKKARLKQEKEKKEVITEERFSTRVVVATAVLMLLSLVGMYFVTVKIVDKRAKENTDSNSNEVESVNVKEINTIKYSEVKDIKSSSYYLFFEKEDDEMNNTYDTLINSLATANYPINFYYVSDMDYGKKEDLDDLEDLKIKDTTLLLVEDGKVKSSYTGSSEVSNYLFSFFVKTSNSNEASNKEEDKEEKKDSDKEEKKEDKKEDKEDKED